jgi:hypothetical protein
MRMPLTTAALALALFTLTGCLAQSSPAPTPLPNSTPVFESEEAALAAAEDAYREYLAVSDAITADGGANPERIKPLVTTEQFQVELDGFDLYTSKSWRTSGESSFEILELQRYSEEGNGVARVSFYACSDSSHVRIIDASGADVTPMNVPDRQTLEVAFQSAGRGARKLVLESAGIWDSAQSC